MSTESKEDLYATSERFIELSNMASEAENCLILLAARENDHYSIVVKPRFSPEQSSITLDPDFKHILETFLRDYMEAIEKNIRLRIRDLEKNAHDIIDELYDPQ